MSLSDPDDPENRDALYELEMVQAQLAAAERYGSRTDAVEAAVRYWKARVLAELCDPASEDPATSTCQKDNK